MTVNNLSELYRESLMISQGQVSCTGLSSMMEASVSHDKFTRLLSSGYMNEEYLWKRAKPICHEISSKDAVLIIDESVEAKPYTDENELICWHYDHVIGKNIKGVSMLRGLYNSGGMSVPVGAEFVIKPIKTINKQHREKRIVPKNSRTCF